MGGGAGAGAEAGAPLINGALDGGAALAGESEGGGRVVGRPTGPRADRRGGRRHRVDDEGAGGGRGVAGGVGRPHPEGPGAVGEIGGGCVAGGGRAGAEAG